MSAAPNRPRAPVFVVGAGRSGTTLLRTMLTSHPEVAMTPESHFVRFTERFGAPERAAPADFEAFWSALTAFPRFADLGVSPAKVRAVLERGEERDFGAVYGAILTAYAEAAAKPRSGDKTPRNSRYVDRLFDWFPDARIIFVVRDPRAVVASALKAPWVTGQLSGECGPRWSLSRFRRTIVANQAEGWHRVYARFWPRWATDRRVTLVAYERLVNDPASVTAELCSFLDIAHDTSMIDKRADARGAAHRHYGDWTAEHEARAAAPINTASLDKWREALSVAEIALIETACARPMEALGYTREVRGAGSAVRSLPSLALPSLRRFEGRLRTRYRALRKAD